MYSTASAPPGTTTPPAAGGAETAQPELPTSSSSFSSRLAHLLESKDIPLDSDVPVIRRIIAENQTRVDALNAQIDILQIAMERLIAERDERQECVRMHIAVVSPVRRMPPELMCEIFALTPCTRRIGEDTVYCPPWRLGHICRSWRDWAHADPSLWRTIEISNNHYSACESLDLHDTHPPSMIETQLRLSGNGPLTVIFGGQDCDIKECQLLELLLPQCARWSAVRLECRKNFSALSHLLDGARGRVPQLKKLQLITHNHDSSLGRPNSFSIAPNLREVILTDPAYIRTSSPLHIPWGRITHYRGLYRAERQLEIILEAASSLIECGLGFVDEVRAISDDKVATLPHLRRLYVGNSEFLNHLTAPGLDILDSFGAIHPVLNFMYRSSCRLTRLLLEACDAGDTLVRILGNLPSLEYLLVEAWYWSSTESDNFFNSMTISGAFSDVCPRLTSFIYSHRAFNNPLSRERLLTGIVVMAQSRLHQSSPCSLSSLLFFSNHADTSFRQRFAEETQALADQGLDVAFLRDDEWPALVAKERL
ncbi:hypothetical protein C8R44DRAFT_57072 [Mycena epipterygia]|nr:hypothetical protein C8R44DRAFT_57072 [Mycena epipterygia]